jgi:RecA-family ATPase
MFINPERLLEVSHIAQKVEVLVDEFRPGLLILDTSADVFGGDEINRRQVRTFVSLLRRMAMDYDMAVLLLSHPSVAGMQTGTGLSGSTAWNNSVRSRLYLTADRDDDDLRTLKGMKSNYARKGGEMKLRWHEGAFVLDDGKLSPGAALVANNADKVFLKLLSAINGSGRRVSSSKSSAFAPTLMAAMPEREGVSKKSLAEAMARLFAEKKGRCRHGRAAVKAARAAGGGRGRNPAEADGFQPPYRPASNRLPTASNGGTFQPPYTPGWVGTPNPVGRTWVGIPTCCQR